VMSARSLSMLLLLGHGTCFQPHLRAPARQPSVASATTVHNAAPRINVGGDVLRACPSPHLSAAASSNDASIKDTLLTSALIMLWYAASVVCNQSSKRLLKSMGAQSLTFAQLLVSSGCGAAVLLLVAAAQDGENKSWLADAIPTSFAQLADTSALAAAFTAGFVTLNACFDAMHVSLVMVLRAAEPLTTLCIGYAFFGTRVPLRRAAALLPVVAGCACSAVGTFRATGLGLGLAIVSNVCFSLRALLGKRLSAKYGTGPLEAFFQLCAVGAVLQALLLGVGSLSGLGPGLRQVLSAFADSPTRSMVLLNGATFYAYLQLSWVCLGRMSAVSHSLANSMRRPATIVAALLVAPVKLTILNWIGMGVACAGALLYGVI